MNKKRFRGCLLGGAIGDALGAPVEFLTDAEIRMKYGKSGITDLNTSENGKAKITDDTQMTLFTAEGLLTAMEGGVDSNVIPYVYNAYMAWLYTQGEGKEGTGIHKSSLLSVKELFARRGPGNTCLGALISGNMGNTENPINHSKGCGGVMRSAPVGLMFESKKAFHIACECAAITHGHPSGYISAGIMACIVSEIIGGSDIQSAVEDAVSIAKEFRGHEECVNAIEKAVYLSGKSIDSRTAISDIGEGWVGEEAIAIAIYCSLKYKDDFSKAIITAVNHDGDSDSTGAVTGNIMGAYLGMDKIPAKWIEQVELNELITDIADNIFNGR